jgi:hypothetical protein
LDGVYRIGLRERLEVQSPGHMRGWERVRGEETCLNVEIERSPGFDRDIVGLAWHAYGRSGPSAEYARDGRLD